MLDLQPPCPHRRARALHWCCCTCPGTPGLRLLPYSCDGAAYLGVSLVSAGVQPSGAATHPPHNRLQPDHGIIFSLFYCCYKPLFLSDSKKICEGFSFAESTCLCTSYSLLDKLRTALVKQSRSEAVSQNSTLHSWKGNPPAPD